MFVYSGDELIPVGYTDSDFMSDKDSKKSTFGYVYIRKWRLVGGVRNSFVSQTLQLKLNMWLHLKLQKKLYDFASSYKILR